jgi:hypothetical protein
MWGNRLKREALSVIQTPNEAKKPSIFQNTNVQLVHSTGFLQRHKKKDTVKNKNKIRE